MLKNSYEAVMEAGMLVEEEMRASIARRDDGEIYTLRQELRNCGRTIDRLRRDNQALSLQLTGTPGYEHLGLLKVLRDARSENGSLRQALRTYKALIADRREEKPQVRDLLEEGKAFIAKVRVQEALKKAAPVQQNAEPAISLRDHQEILKVAENQKQRFHDRVCKLEEELEAVRKDRNLLVDTHIPALERQIAETKQGCDRASTRVQELETRIRLMNEQGDARLADVERQNRHLTKLYNKACMEYRGLEEVVEHQLSVLRENADTLEAQLQAGKKAIPK